MAGAVQLEINNADRFTLIDNVDRDYAARSWVRVPTSGACAFCLSLGAISDLRVKPEYDKWHSNCRCTNRVLFGSEKAPELPEYKEVRAAYKDAVSEIKVNRELTGYLDLPQKQRPKELALTTKNILKIVRETTGLR